MLNLVFDMGGVLMYYDPESFMDIAGITDPEERRLIRNEVFRAPEWVMMDRGLYTAEDAEPYMLANLPQRLHPLARHMLYDWWKPGLKPMEGMYELVKELKDKGYPLYLLSNAGFCQPEYWKKLPVSTLIDAVFLSCDAKLVKPMKEIYDAFTAHFGLEARECLFIDDSPVNVEGAIFAGWQGIVFNGSADELRQKLCARHIL